MVIEHYGSLFWNVWTVSMTDWSPSIEVYMPLDEFTLERDIGDFKRYPTNSSGDPLPSFSFMDGDVLRHRQPWEYFYLTGDVYAKLQASNAHWSGETIPKAYNGISRNDDNIFITGYVPGPTLNTYVSYGIGVYYWDERYGGGFFSCRGQSYAYRWDPERQVMYAARGHEITSSVEGQEGRIQAEIIALGLADFESSEFNMQSSRPKTFTTEPLLTPRRVKVQDLLSRYTNPVNWADLAQSAYSDIGMWNGNGQAYVNDLREFKELVESTIDAARELSTGNLAKAIPDLYLSFHYGYNLFYLDSVELVEVLATLRTANKGVARVQATSQDGYWTNHYQVDYDQFKGFENDLYKLIRQLDLFPSLENAWDMTPLSFVLDWFVGVGDCLTGVENFLQLKQEHEVLAVGLGSKLRDSLPCSRLGYSGFDGSIDIVYNIRRYQKNLIHPPYLPKVTIGGAANHGTESLFLILSIFGDA